jgi:prepilin-type N-terminal cleavage/methylation domain-containing protein/prepilin-type processing-associated H-X9-DG protein
MSSCIGGRFVRSLSNRRILRACLLLKSPEFLENKMKQSFSGVRSRPSGFTLIELLVVMAVIGVLAGLLFPAVQSIRESARNKECLNNIRNIVEAHANYEVTNRHYPAGWLDRRVAVPGVPDMDFRYGWAVLISGQIELDNLYKTYNVRNQYWANPMNQIWVDVRTPVSTFICPSDPAPEASVVWSGLVDTMGNPAEPAKMNYCGNFGVGKIGGVGRALGPHLNYNNPAPYAGPGLGSGALGDAFGIFCCNSRVRHRDITDGHSSTIVFGERGGSDWDHLNALNPIQRDEYPNLLIRVGIPKNTITPNCPLGAPVAGLGGDGSGQVGMGPLVQSTYFGTGPDLLNTAGNPYDPRDYQINAATDYDADGLNAYSSGFSSAHPGGANFAFSDGATRFLNSELDIKTFQQLLQRNDGQVTKLPF